MRLVSVLVRRPKLYLLGIWDPHTFTRQISAEVRIVQLCLVPKIPYDTLSTRENVSSMSWKMHVVKNKFDSYLNVVNLPCSLG